MTIRCVDWDTEKANEREKKGKNRSDPYITSLVAGIKEAEYVRDENLDLDNDKSPCVFRGLGKSPRIHKCIENKIDYYYIDTGYFGNNSTKVWHRIAKNNLQTLNHLTKRQIEKVLTGRINDQIERHFHPKEFEDLIERRFGKFFGRYENLRFTRRERSNKILVVPPSQKVFNHFGGDAEEWTDQKMKEFKNYTDKELVLRPKVGRGDRLKFTVQQQLIEGQFDSLITFNSIASIEAIVEGFPATVLGPNAGSFLSETDIKNIDNPRWPDENDIKEHLLYLSFCQFTATEMSTGFAWKVINLLQGNQKPNIFNL